jgi:hypothetical protein
VGTHAPPAQAASAEEELQARKRVNRASPLPSLAPDLVGPNDVVGGEGPHWLAFVVAGVLLFGLGALL